MGKFRRDAIMEQVLKMKANEPGEYARLQDKTKQAAAIYERAKRDAQDEKETS